MLEFAFILPILMTILVGIIDLSVMLYDKAIITNASREGARYGVVVRGSSYASNASVITYTQTYCANSLITFTTTPTSAVITSTPSVSPPSFGATLTVHVSYTYTDLILHNFVNHAPQWPLSATTVMAYE